MSDIATWVAPIATMIAAIMTAANLGVRTTGWGFVVFTIGSICWSIVGVSTGQTNLLASNVFLTLVNVIGIWRWLGRQRAYHDGSKAAERKSRKSATPTLFTATGIGGMAVVDDQGDSIGTAVEALIECETGIVGYVVVATGGIGGIAEKLRAISRRNIQFRSDQLQLGLSQHAFEALPPLIDGDWPARAPEHRDEAEIA